MMWHEARKQERKIRGLMVDYKKRAERRREYYEKIKQDPTQFLRVYGRPYKIHLDPAVALSAESPQSMMPWQGQTDNMIDRFDVRAHLDQIPEYKSAPPLPMTKEEEEEDRKCSYERYRTLVENECAALTEEQCLHQIYLDEQFGPIKRTPDEEKKKLAEKKAAIGFTYDDSSTCPVLKEEEDDDSSDTDVETADLDVTLDVDALTPDQLKMLNQCAQQYGMRDDDYVQYLRKDKEELEALRQAKLLEEEKAQFAGRKSRRERRAYKEKKLQGRKISPPSYAARASPKYEPYKRSSSSSKSRSRSPENAGKVMYITSFGGESEEDAGVLQGPSLPPDLHSQTNRADSKGGRDNSRLWKATSRSNRKPSTSRYRHRSRSPVHSTSKHRWLGRRNSRSRSTSRSRSRSNPRSNSYRIDRRRRSRSQSRSRSRSREWKRSHSSHYGSDGRGSRNVHSRYQPRRRYSRSRSRSRSSNSSRSSSRSYSSSSSRSRSRSRSKSRSPSPHNKASCRSKSKSPAESTAAAALPKPVIKRYRRSSLSSSAEDSKSDSDGGKSPAPSTENTTASSTFTPSKSKDSRVPAPNVLGKSTLESQTSALTPKERLRRRMQAALNRQYKADKRAELQKLERVEQERQDREDELRSRVMEMRRRERERRHRELEEMERDRYSQKYSNSSDSDNWSHSRSPPHRSRRSRSSSPRRSRSRSRSLSRDRGLVDY